MKKIPVFVFKTDPEQVGNGIYSMVACFTNLGVHVPYTFLAHSENEYLQSVGEPILCDSSCEHRRGHMEDFSKERHHSSYEVQKIIDGAKSFHLPDKFNE